MISKIISLMLSGSIYSFLTQGSPQVIRIGGIYPITNIVNAKINRNGAQWLAGSLMAMRDLNSDPQYIASNIEFKLAVRDSRKTFSNTVVGCLALAQTVFKSSGSHVIVGAGEFCQTKHVLFQWLPCFPLMIFSSIPRVRLLRMHPFPKIQFHFRTPRSIFVLLRILLSLIPPVLSSSPYLPLLEQDSIL